MSRSRPAPFLRLVALAVPAALAIAAGCAPSTSLAPFGPVAEPLTGVEVDAAGALLRLEDRREVAIDLLGAFAAAPEAPIRARAAYTAGRLGDAAARPLVRSLFADPDTAVAAAAAFAAGLLRDSAAVPALAEFLDAAVASARPSVAVEAAAALGRIGDAPSRAALAAFLAGADSSAFAIRPVVREALIGSWRAGETEVAPFVRWLAHADPEIRWRAVYGLTRRARPEAVAPVLGRLDDPEPLARAHALRGLASSMVAMAGVPRETVVPRIIAALDDPAYPVRIEAIRVLAGYDEEESVAALEGKLSADSPHEVVVAIEALGRMGPRASAALRTLAATIQRDDAPAYLREVGVEAMAAIDPANARVILRAFADDPAWRVRAGVARGLRAQRTEGLPGLQALARDPDPRVAAAAVQGATGAVGSAGIEQIRPLLIEALQSGDVHIRTAALQGMSWLADPATYPLLLDAYDAALRDPQNNAALAAVDAIAELGLTGSVTPDRAFFARFSRSEDYLVRQRAATRFRAAARAAWGEPLPIETSLPEAEYRRLVETWAAPSPPDRPLPRVRIETDRGTIDLLLYGDRAPLTVANFLRLADAGFFDGQEWPRVVPNFVVQGGDPRGDTSGGPGYSIRDELNRERYRTGTVGMALSGPDTGGSQFFIGHSPQPHLDGVYTVFGEVTAGQEVAEVLLPGDRIRSVREIEPGS